MPIINIWLKSPKTAISIFHRIGMGFHGCALQRLEIIHIYFYVETVANAENDYVQKMI